MLDKLPEQRSAIEAEASVSVLLPVYFADASTEAGLLLRRALESVHDQRFPGEFEILIVDDGSPTPVESLMDIISPTLANRARWVRYPRNQGLVYALNTGLREARFPWVARLDADDRWVATKIEKQFSLIAGDPDLTIVATGMKRVKPDGTAVDEHIRPGSWRGVLQFFKDVGCPFPHGSVVARKSIWRLLGGYPHEPAVRHCEDFALWGRWLRFFKPAMIEELLYDYTVSADSVSGKFSAQQAQASGLVHGAFIRLDLVDVIPDTLPKLADTLGISVLQAGVLTYRMWHYRLAAKLPPDAEPLLRLLMPDRNVETVTQGSRPALNLGQILKDFESPGLANRPNDVMIVVR